MKKLVLALGCLALVLAAVSCSMKAPAQATIKAGEEALNVVRAEAAKYVPDQLTAVEKVLADAKAALEKGDYKTAIQLAKDLPQKANDLRTAIEARKAELPGVWAEMAKAVPKLVADTKAAVAKAKGLDKAAKDEAGSKVKEMENTWKKAEGEFKNGNLVEAVSSAEEVKKMALMIQGLLSEKTAKK